MPVAEIMNAVREILHVNPGSGSHSAIDAKHSQNLCHLSVSRKVKGLLIVFENGTLQNPP